MKKVRNLASKKIISGSDYKRLVKEKFSYGFPTVSVTQPSDSTSNTKKVRCGRLHTFAVLPNKHIKDYNLLLVHFFKFF